MDRPQLPFDENERGQFPVNFEQQPPVEGSEDPMQSEGSPPGKGMGKGKGKGFGKGKGKGKGRGKDWKHGRQDGRAITDSCQSMPCDVVLQEELGDNFGEMVDDTTTFKIKYACSYAPLV